jgi:hypothetical protein
MSYLPYSDRICKYYINNTGETSVKGKLVQFDTAADNQVVLTTTDSYECIGVIDEAGIPNGSRVRVCLGGAAEVLLEDNIGSTRSYWAGAGDAGYAETAAAPPGVVIQHFREIGHFSETVAAGGPGTHVLAQLVLHFN